jgi:hypothetical protein
MLWFKVSSPWSSRADRARTRRRYIRLALAPAPLRERAGRLARDTGDWSWTLEWLRLEREARIMRSRPPASSPLRVPIRPAPPRMTVCAVVVTVTRGHVRRGHTDRE